MHTGCTRRWLRRLSFAFPLAVVVGSGCFKSLDESLLDRKDGGHGGGIDAGGKDAGKDAGGKDGGGTGGSDAGGKDGGGTGGTDAGNDAGDAGGIVGYDPQKFPVSTVASAAAPVVLAVDDTDAYHTVDNGISVPLDRTPISGGPTTTLATLERPHALIAPSASAFVFAGGGQNSGTGGSLVRTPKTGGALEPISTSSGVMGPAIGMVAAADGFGYVTFLADPALHKPALARFDLSAGVTTATVLYNAATDESGGPVVVANGCVYWVSSSRVFVMPSTGAPDRNSALANQVSDAVGLAADANDFYYTRSGGSVWSRKHSVACDGTGQPEKMLTQGFTGIRDVIAFGTSPTIAWLAHGNDSANYAGGGIYTMSAGGGTITQIAPQDSGPTTMVGAPNDVVYAVTTGEIRSVPKP